MDSRVPRWLALTDVVGVTLLVQLFIWRLQFLWPRSWMIFPAWLGISFLLRRDTPRTLGWRADNLWPATKQAAAVFLLLALVLVVVGTLLGNWHPIPAQTLSLRRLWLYFTFCLLQQVALQSFLNNRLMYLISDRWVSSALAGLIFGVSHWPNPVLVPITLVGGALTAWLFARQRNIIPLALGQALLGTLVWVVFPVEWHHRMRVGPGYFRWP
jgi:hypothetical protein